MLLAALALAAAAQKQPLDLRLQRVTLELPDADHAVVTLHGEGREKAVVPALKGQRLRLGTTVVPLAGAPTVTVTPAASRVAFPVVLREVGAGILDLDPWAARVVWEGLDAKGRPVISLGGVMDLGDPDTVALPVQRLYDLYTKLVDYSATPTGLNVAVKVLLELYNPFAFEVVATGLQYRLEVGGEPVLAATRPGFRLRATRRSDVLVEQDVPLAELASGLAAFLARKPATFSGVLGIRTGTGERGIPILLKAGM